MLVKGDIPGIIGDIETDESYIVAGKRKGWIGRAFGRAIF